MAAVMRPTSVAVRAANPNEGHTSAGLWRELWDAHEAWGGYEGTRDPKVYHVEYGYSCMGYEIAGGLGAKLARPQREVVVMVGDGSYLMLNSELATSVLLGRKIIVVVLDNRGYGCIERLQLQTGGASYNNMLDDCVPAGGQLPNRHRPLVRWTMRRRRRCR